VVLCWQGCEAAISEVKAGAGGPAGSTHPCQFPPNGRDLPAAFISDRGDHQPYPQTWTRLQRTRNQHAS